MADKPITREEKYLAYLTGDYTGELPKPITRKEKYLYELCLKGMGGEVSPEEIKNAVNEYLEKNPVKPGATTEQAQQIEQNKTDIASLKEETGSLKEDFASKVVYPVEMETLKENCFSLSCNEKIVTLVDNSEMIGKRLKVCGENLFNVDDFRILNKFVNSGEDNSYACLPIYVNPNTAYSINISIKDEAKFNEFKALSGQITIGCRKGYPNDWEVMMFKNLTASSSLRVLSDEYGMLYVNCQYSEQATLDKLW